MIRKTSTRLFAALLLAAIGLTVNVAGVRSATPTPLLEIYDMTKFPATVIVERDGKPFGHYTLVTHGSAAIYDAGSYRFRGAVDDAATKMPLRDQEITLVVGSKRLGLFIQPEGKIYTWKFSQAASGSYI